MRAKIEALGKQLCAQFVERDRVIKGLLLALVARQHVLLLGPPGTSKSALVNALTASIDGAHHFGWLMTRYTVPEELFGPVSLTALKEDRFQRVPSGKLPEAHIAFLDEIWKANSAILNALLTLVNERVWHNAGLVSCPLETLIGASNELPESDELSALYDRFGLRFWVEPIKGADAFTSMLLAGAPAGKPVITLDELHAAQRECADVVVGKEAAEALAEIRHELTKAQVHASDRRYKQSLGLLKANAWLQGESEIGVEDFDVLADVLWAESAQRPTVVKVLERFDQAEAIEAKLCVDSIRDLLSKMPSAGEARTASVLRCAKEARVATEKLDKLLAGAKAGRAKNAVRERANELKAMIMPLKQEAATLLNLNTRAI